MHICIYMHAFMHTYLHIYLYIYTYIYIHRHMYIYMYVHIDTCTYTCMYNMCYNYMWNYVSVPEFHWFSHFPKTRVSTTRVIPCNGRTPPGWTIGESRCTRSPFTLGKWFDHAGSAKIIQNHRKCITFLICKCFGCCGRLSFPVHSQSCNNCNGQQCSLGCFFH